MADDLSPGEQAEGLFAEYLSARERGEEPSFEELLADHPQLQTELQELQAEWSDLTALRARLPAPRRQESWSPLRGFSRTPWDKAPEAPEEVLEQLGERQRPIDRYRYLGEVGRGGMGVVLRVHDDDLRRDLAMKVMLSNDAPSASTPAANDTRSLGRFLEEAQVTGQLDHPGIVPVHEVGLDAQGHVFFTMKLVHGQDLAKVFELVKGEREGWTRMRALGVLLKVCEAMSYAHAKGVVHRDLKPSNVMVGGFGAVYVMDWGLARVVGSDERETPVDLTGLRTVRSHSDSDSGLATLDGDVIGTPAYMSPEQAQGRTTELGPPTDVYAVGAMLYHLLAGRMPFVGASEGRRTVLRRVREEPPTPLHALASDVPAELVAIVEKAMARVPQERYATMEALGEDLRAYLEGRVVRAYETGAIAELRKWIGRNRALASALAAGLLVALLGLGTAAWVQSRARAQEQASRKRLAGINEELETANLDLAAARNRALEKEALATERAEEATRERQAADRVVDFLVGLFESPSPELARGEEVTAKELLDRGVATIEDEDDLDPRVRAQLLEAMGSAYFSLGRFAESRPLFVESEELRAAVTPPSPDLPRSRVRLGKVMTELGEMEAVAYLRELSDDLGATLGPDHPDTLMARSALMLALQRDEMHEEIARRIDPLLADLLRVHGEESLTYLARLNGKAVNLFVRGQPEEAEAVYREALQLNERAFGEDHPTTLSCKANLASLYFLTDEIADAIGLYEEVIPQQRRILGEHHTNLLHSLSNLANCYVHVDRSEEAKQLLLEVIEKSRTNFGEDHDDTLAAYINISSICIRLAQLDEAEQFLIAGHEGLLRRHGPNHPATITCLMNLGAVADRKGNNADAEHFYLGALDGRLRIFGPGHLETLKVTWVLADFYHRRGRLEEALPLAEELVRETPEDNARHAGRVQLRDEIAAALAAAAEKE